MKKIPTHLEFSSLPKIIGEQRKVVISIAGWSVSIALHAIAKTLMSFSIFRFFLGFFEAGNWPGATKSNAEWFPAKERGIAQGIFGAGAGSDSSSGIHTGTSLSCYWCYIRCPIFAVMPITNCVQLCGKI